MSYHAMITELESVKRSVSKASNEWEGRFVYGVTGDNVDGDREYVEYLLRIAYLTLLSFLDKNNFKHISEYLTARWKLHEGNLLDSYMSEHIDEPLLKVTGTLWEVIYGLENILPKKDSKYLKTEGISLTSILESIPLTVHRLNLRFNQEGDLDALAEGLLLPLYPDLNPNPSLTLPESYRMPDSAIPSLNILLEYKFITKKADVRKVIDEMQADIRNYAQEPWKHLLFVVGQNEPFTTKERVNETIQKEPSSFDSINLVLITHNPKSTD